MVKAKVSSGEDAVKSEVIRDGLRDLQARDKALDAWPRTDLCPLRRRLGYGDRCKRR